MYTSDELYKTTELCNSSMIKALQEVDKTNKRLTRAVIVMGICMVVVCMFAMFLVYSQK